MTTTTTTPAAGLDVDTVGRDVRFCWEAQALAGLVAHARERLCHGGECDAMTIDVVVLVPTVDHLPTGEMITGLLRSTPQVSDHSGIEILLVMGVTELKRRVRSSVAGVGVIYDAISAMDESSWEEICAWNEESGSNSTNTTWLGLRGPLLDRSSDEAIARIVPSSRLPLATIDDLVRPLRQIPEQCGWRLAMELLARLAAPPPTPTTADSSPFLTTMGSLNHLPFQLLMMILRWTYCHPAVVSLLQRPLTRKLAHIPQERIRRDLLAEIHDQLRLWAAVHPLARSFDLSRLKLDSHPTLSSKTTEDEQQLADEDADNSAPSSTSADQARLSQCALWDVQKTFYQELGIRAWSSNIIPFGVSSSAYLARQYAVIAVEFLIQTASTSTPSSQSDGARTPNCYVWEAASGSCKFLHAFLVHFYDIARLERLQERHGLIPCVVATDLSEQVLQSRSEMACFQGFLADHRLDFAHFDTSTFLHGADEERGALFLRHQRRQWRVGMNGGPVFVMGNYFFDSLQTDAFVAAQRQGEKLKMYEGLISKSTASIPDMRISLQHVDTEVFYDQPLLGNALKLVIRQVEQEWATRSQPTSMRTSLILFPVEGMHLLTQILCPHLIGNAARQYPVSILIGDATYSHRDAIPKSLVDSSLRELVIPQLSPHPDCFCLPVDLDVLTAFTTELTNQAGPSSIFSSTASTTTSDTFNMFFVCSADVEVGQTVSSIRCFDKTFDRFTPSDCDLLWGMMGVDEGARSLSLKSQLSLLTQTGYDWDLFLVLQWPMLRRFQIQMHDSSRAGDSDHIFKNQIVDAGKRCLRQYYALQESPSVPSSTWGSGLIVLQFARWLYGFESHGDIIALFERSKPLWEADEHLHWRIAYLLGICEYRRGSYWSALTWFRRYQQCAPVTRVRGRRWIARTLLRLQELKNTPGPPPSQPLQER